MKRPSAAALLSCALLVLPTLVMLCDLWIRYGDGLEPWAMWLLCTQAGLLLVRGKFPLTVGATVPLSLVSNIGWLASLFALYSLARHYGVRWQTWLVYGLIVVFEVVSALTWTCMGSWPIALYEALLNCALQGLPLVLGILVRTRQELARRLTDLDRAREREDYLLTQQVLVAERTRLARDMHDVIAHKVALISVQAAALQVTTPDPAAHTTARTVRELASATLSELRDMLGVLRTHDTDRHSTTPQPGLADLPHLISSTELAATFHTTVALTGPSARAWPDTVQSAVFRTVQEGLTNAAKHAPGAAIHVELYEEGSALHVSVRHASPEPGAPRLELPSSGFGLEGLRERARLAGGSVDTHLGADGAHLLTARFPAR
ncbi:sensor histidine kinase [Streptomyces sp. NPDC059070]|uniref:sensor histidine kinase n=1 Tax=Streptomyces sp. NPDC059070 TaxID=3346713 RepID=UPI0036B2B7AD